MMIALVAQARNSSTATARLCEVRVVAFLEHKVPPPLLMLVVAALMWLANRLMGMGMAGGLWLIMAIVFALLGIGVAVAGRNAFVRAGTTLNPINLNAASQLVTTGIYQHTRNPMYLGMALLLIGVAMMFANAWLLLGPIAFGLFIQRFQIWPEEQVMQGKFGAEYRAYQQRVRRWI